ncbi:M13 family metallopeptidase [Fulvivirgaceae bacterium PWU20]|uniref:M13 family metallopeptidase n=2 Tax=Chryseosolibacter indicus TaxID=2782351 RepID=A0ABS5VSM6_9BACT|nr:M13 family metallopeptidase [Chryseosolibacter indicus]
MDFTTKPGDDFMKYAGGVWLQNNPVPGKETRWGSFTILRDFNVKAVRQILEESAADKSAAAGSVKKRVGDFYTAAMDSATVEQQGFNPARPDFERAGSVKSTSEVLDEIINQRTKGIGSPLFGVFVGQDRKHPQTMAVQLSQGGTSLPDRDYYLKSDARTKKIQTAFNNYITTLFTLAGQPEDVAKQKAEVIFKLEKRLAQAQMSRVEMRDPYKTYNKFSVADFSKNTPSFNWASTLSKLNLGGQDSILVNAPAFFAVADSVLKNTPVNDWQTYLQWNVLKSAAPYLSKPFVDANFAFTQTLNGQKVQTPRWQRMSSLTDNTIGELLGQLYVEKHFKPSAKARMDEMIKNLIKAYEIRIKNLDWMSDVTKQKALDKLHAFTPKIGYPEKWKTYDGLEITNKTFYQNVRNAGQWTYNDMVSQLGKPVDKKRFGMTPPTVNAYYNPVNNEIVFPAGILQYPFFHPDADDAFNYGAIGAVIGHEISHGFDDSGSQYDKDGTLRNWWTAEDLAKFKERAKKLQEQFDAYTVLDTLHVNGKLTLGENIGDLGGLNAAYEAFKMTAQGKSNKKIDGFTPDQRFFLAWAQVWRANTLPETVAQLIITDPHSPSEYRTIGAPVNMDAWYKAFNVKPGDKLYKKPEDRVKIW